MSPTQPSHHTPRKDAGEHSEHIHDVRDTERDILEYAHDPAFVAALRACQSIVKSYDESNDRAKDLQRKHKFYTHFACWSGLGAVWIAAAGCALGRQIPSYPHTVLLWIEILAATLAVAVVVLGMAHDVKRDWLRERNKAERLRLLKFSYLTDPSRWTSRAPTADDFASELSNIENEAPGLESWMREELPPKDVQTPGPAVATSVLINIASYYRKKRLDYQRKYFKKRSGEFAEQHKRGAYYPTLFFFLSIVCVALHSLADLIKEAGGNQLAEQASAGFLFLALALPALAAGVRTFQLSRELARNSSRYAAKLHALDNLSTRLSAAIDQLNVSEEAGREALLRAFSHCEYVMEGDQREWTRLMLEAEWF